MSTLVYADTLPGGKHWSFTMRRNHRLKLVDVDGGGNAGMVFYNLENLFERYNAPDTLKCQHTFRLTAGHCLYSDMGRVFCSIVSDTFGWHETVCGTSNKDIVAARWGSASYQTHRNARYQNGYDSLLVEAAKYGMGRRDLAASVNFFSKVTIGQDGAMRFNTFAAKAGAAVELRFEMNTLVLLHTCPHPLDTAETYPNRPIRFEIHDGPSAAADDACRLSSPENGRGFENNRIHHACGCC